MHTIHSGSNPPGTAQSAFFSAQQQQQQNNNNNNNNSNNTSGNRFMTPATTNTNNSLQKFLARQQQQQQQQQQPPPPPLFGTGQIPPSYVPSTTPSKQQQQQYYSSNNASASSSRLLQDSSVSQTENWQQQMREAQRSRQAASPHHYARAAAQTSRQHAFAQIVTTTPNSKTKSSSQQDEFTTATTTNNNNTNNNTHQRPRVEPPPVSQLVTEWSSLDMSGQGLVNVSSPLFNYNFLQTLYIGHNRLTSLPGAIGKLSNLKVLDVSSNLLSSLPPEIGLLSRLQKLYLFDNNLTDLPFELGTCFQLEFIGIEGNPLSESVRTTLAQKGTRGLIIELRDNAPVELPPSPRQWIEVSDKHRRASSSKPPNENEKDSGFFTVLSYNVLCDRYATPTMYGYTPSWALDIKYRRENIKEELYSLEPDFVCLQEVDVENFEDFFSPQLAYKHYKGLFYSKNRPWTKSDAERRNVDGCAIFYKAEKYKLVEKHLIEFSQLAMKRDDFKKTADMYNRVMNKDNIAVVALFENRVTGTKLVVTNAHILWDPQFKDVKVVQTALLVEELERLLDRFKSIAPTDPNLPVVEYPTRDKLPLVICGDFNSTPDSGVYKLLSATSALLKDHEDLEGRVYGRLTEQGIKNSLNLKSAYSLIGELPFTNYTPGFVGNIDYIWYTAGNIHAEGVLGHLDKDYISRCVGFPNPHYPSDHIPVMAQFTLKKPKQEVTKPPPPDFGNTSSSLTKK